MDMTFEVHPYQASRWADPETPSASRRGSAAFKQAGKSRDAGARDISFWRSTLELLETETGQLKRDGTVIIEAGFAEWDLRADRSGPLARVSESHPGVVVSLISKVHGPMRFATDAYELKYRGDPPGWQANIRAIALTLRALRDLDRWGVARSGQQYAGWLALPAGGTGLTFPSADAALRWMQEHKPKGFTGDTTSELYKALAIRMHPDSGKHAATWDPDDWTKLENAKLLLTTAKMM
jgi:hypothetical protein